MKLLIALLSTLSLAAGCLGSPAAEEPATTTESGYAPLLDTPIRGLSEAEIADLRAGKGMGLALPAELNGYPGPRHVLDLGDELALSSAQRERVQALYDAMSADARRLGEEVLARHAALEDAFRARSVDPETLGALTGALAAAEGELRLVHLRAHLATMEVLTHEQVMRYNELRGYGSGEHGGDGHGGHGG